MSTHNRERLPNTRNGKTHKFTLDEESFYIRTGEYPDGRLGELFIVVDQEGSELGGVYDAFGTAISMLLQSGWDIDELAKKFRRTRFEPSGWLPPGYPIRKASSPIDYIMHWLLINYGHDDEVHHAEGQETIATSAQSVEGGT